MRAKTHINSDIKAGKINPAPIAKPRAAAAQIIAEDVNPLIFNPWRKIVPPPKKPIPDTTWAAMRDGSPFVGFCDKLAVYIESSISSVAETDMRIRVRSPTNC